MLQRWKNKWYSVGNQCSGLERTTSQNNISLSEAQGAFYILGIGLLLALIVLIGERIYYSRKCAKEELEISQASEERVQQESKIEAIQLGLVFDKGTEEANKYSTPRKNSDVNWVDSGANNNGIPLSELEPVSSGFKYDTGGNVVNRKNKGRSKHKKQHISLTYNNAIHKEESTDFTMNI